MKLVITRFGLLGLLALQLVGCGVADLETGQRPEHLVLVVFDTVRADRMSIYGNDRQTTPFLEAISSELLKYKDAKSPAPWTVPGHASIFTGLWPAEHRAQWGRMRLRSEYETLAETLRDAGFCTTGLSANLLAGPETGLDQGFERFEVIEGNWTEKTRQIVGELPEILQQAETSGCRLFLFLNLMDAHIPYNTTQHGHVFGIRGAGPVDSAKVKWRISAGRRKFDAGDRRRHTKAYDAAVRYLDDVSRELIELLRQQSLLYDSLVVFTADHGEGLGSHPEIGHSISVWEEQLAVPLLIRFPDGSRAGEVVSDSRSTTQLTPSLLDWLGVERPQPLIGRPTLDEPPALAVTADYRSYFAEGNRETNRQMEHRYPKLAKRVHHTHVLYCGDYKLMVDATGRRRLYHLDEDPEEQVDLAATAREPLENCWEEYRRLLGQGRFTLFTDGSTSDDADIAMETLRSLGYVQ